LARLVVDVVEGGDGDAEVDVGAVAAVRGQHVDVVVGDRVKDLRFSVAIHIFWQRGLNTKRPTKRLPSYGFASPRPR
jgi:hypothetical protein